MISWPAQEMGSSEWGDQQVNRRLVHLVERLAEQSIVSILAAFAGAGVTKAAYRLLCHDALSWDDIRE